MFPKVRLVPSWALVQYQKLSSGPRPGPITMQCLPFRTPLYNGCLVEKWKWLLRIFVLTGKKITVLLTHIFLKIHFNSQCNSLFVLIISLPKKYIRFFNYVNRAHLYESDEPKILLELAIYINLCTFLRDLRYILQLVISESLEDSVDVRVWSITT